MTRVLFLSLVCAVLLPSCIIVNETDSDTTSIVGTPSDSPQYPMSDTTVYPADGDMVALLPSGWFLIDVEELVSSDVFAVATNSDYSLSIVFARVRHDDELDRAFESEGVQGLARLSMMRREQRTVERLKRVGQFERVEYGVRQFGRYAFTTDDGATVTHVAVFRSLLNNVYEIALVQHPETGRVLPTEQTQQELFQSLLSTLVY